MVLKVPPGTSEAPAPGGRPALDRWVFWSSAVLVVAFIGWGVVHPPSLGAVTAAVLSAVVRGGGWAFVLAASGFVVFALWLAASRYGRIPLGRDGEAPEFRTISWVAMMFSAGMGIGLMFYGVSEPLAHFSSPPPGTVPAGSDEALDVAMATTLFHWTLHPWAIYAVVGLAIAYSTFRRGRRSLISSAFEPLLGARRSAGPLGRAVDVMAIFATLFGSAASLGLGALQIGGGLQAGGFSAGATTGFLVVVVVGLTIAFVASAVSGVAKGIQWLSTINMGLAAVLAVFLFVAGPTILVLNLLPTAVGDYFGDLAQMAARTGATGGDATEVWLSGWTVFYWAWWISWTPFVGMFIARISRGRTIRQFVTGVILVPSTVSLVWFAVFGGTALHLQRTGTDLAGQAPEAQLFGLLHAHPLGVALGVVAMVLIAIFFVSGADAASVVMGTLSQRGTLHPSRAIVVFWGLVTGAIAVIMLLVGGDDALTGIQNLTIVMAVPFGLVMVMLCVALTKDLRHDPLIRRSDRCRRAVEEAVDHGLETYGERFVLTVAPQEAPGGPRTAEMNGRAVQDRAVQRT